jgi:tetratricopeptide (TPR) repeat protein
VAHLSDLLGQRVLAGQLCVELKRPETRLTRLTGPAGSGKSHVARQVAARWREQGGTVAVAVGDDEHSTRELYPLLSGLSRAHADWAKLAATGTRSALGVADSTIGTFGVGTSIFDLLTAAFRQRAAHALAHYSDAERDVVLDLRRLARSRHLLLVADNAHWWDAESLRLLSDVLSDELRAAVPQLDAIMVLMADTEEEQTVVAPGPFAAVTRMSTPHTFRTARCSREAFPLVLQAFGLTDPLPADVLDALFSATHGHLKLMEQIVAYAQRSAATEFFAPVDDSYISTLVAARVASLGAHSPAVSGMLVAAAVLGLSFSERDLECMAGGEPSDLRARVEQAASIGFFEQGRSRIAFSHEVIRSTILGERSAAELRTLHSKLSGCLGILRPGDYAARAAAHVHADETEAARNMLALASVSQLRRGMPTARVLERVRAQLPNDPEFVSYVEVMGHGYSAIDAGDYVAPIPSLRTPVPSESTVMAAERNYLVALCTLEQQTLDGFAEARTILGSWAREVRHETELHVRFLLLLQQAQVLSEMFDEARESELRIEQNLLARTRYDPDAAAMLQVQNRRASAVNAPEVAMRRISESVSFFRRGTDDPSRDQLELYRSLNNLAACELRLGRDADALAHAEEAERVALDSPDIVHRLDVLASNIVLAAYRSGALDIADAVARQRLVIESPEGSGDKFLHRCNLVAYLLLASRDEEASSELDRLRDELQSGGYVETYLIFYPSALRVALAALRGDVEEAIARHTAMDEFASTIRWPTAGYVRRRQELLHQVLPSFTTIGDRVAADRLLIDSRPAEIGPAWPYYGRIMPCAELSFWSDS